MVKVLQLNLNHCRAAQDLLALLVIEQQAEVAMLSEPYKDKHEGQQYGAAGNPLDTYRKGLSGRDTPVRRSKG